MSYTYDGDGRRVKKGTSKLYWYGVSGEVLVETDTAGNNPAEYVFFNGQRIARRDPSGTVYYYFEDHLGTSRVIVQAGQNTACYDADFYPFGGERVITNTCAQNYKFTGKERDSETGNDYFGARFYASNLGRFLSADPLFVTKERLRDPQQLNLFTYVRNNPLRYVDPDGLKFVVYVFYAKDLTFEQKAWLKENEQAVRDAIAAKYKEAGVEEIEFREGSTLSDKQINEAIETNPAGVGFLNFADKSFAGVEAGGGFGVTDSVRSVVFLGNLVESKTDRQTAVLRASEVGSHELGHGQRLESNWWLFKTIGVVPVLRGILDRTRNNLMDESRPRPERPARIDTKSDINQRVIREINRIGDNTPKP